MTRKNQHVVPHDDKWAVRGAGNSKVTKQFDTQREAIEHARGIATNQQSEVLVHNKQVKFASGTATETTHFLQRDDLEPAIRMSGPAR
ncbi:DUF2188 domain-containing protein [Stutzerimonas nitrititolerans]|uniref:DUF2188 domain-containing protein n=1 Tax=Stutzerimonas nitrititolerans TaxID=2482751 RepID=UPI00406BAD98